MNIKKNYFENRNNLEKIKSKDQIFNKHQKSLEIINTMLDRYKLAKISEKKKFLDIGQGDGSFVNFLQHLDVNSNGCDIDTVNLEKDRLPFNDNTYDFAMMYSVIEHVNNSENLLNEAYRVLKLGGVLIIITPNFKYSFKTFYDDPTHTKPFTNISLKKILEIYSFKNITVQPWTTNCLNFIWSLPFAFYYCSKILRFRNDTKLPIPKFLKGQSDTMISVCTKI